MVVGALALAGCGSSGDGPPAAGPTVSPTDGAGAGGGPTAPEPTTPPVPSGDAGSTGEWTSGTTTVVHDVPVPPVPQLLRIRSAAHPDSGYDRIVFDFDGPLPGYTVRYVDEVRQDGSGELVDMPGRRYLLVVFTPAQAHTDAGQPLVSPTRRTLDYPMIRGYVLVGDFEAQVSVAIGLDDQVGYRVGELPGQPGQPGRIYVDVAA
jgi:hypothetical protein